MNFGLHIKNIPLDWKVVKFGDILLSSDYGTSEPTNSMVGYPVLRMGNMKNGKISVDDLVYLEMNDETFEKYKLNKGDLLFNRTNSYEHIGKVAIFDLEGEYTFSSYLVRLKVDTEKAIPKYINYFMNLESSRKDIRRLATKGVQQVNVNPTTLKKLFHMCIPNTIKEQQKIATILSTWDKAIELKEKLIEQKKDLKKGLMQKLLTGEVRLPGFKGEWKSIKLGEFVKLQGGYAFKSSEFKQKGIPIVRISNISPEITDNNQEFVYYDEIKISENYRVNFGDILIAMSGATTGKVGIYKKKQIAYLNQRVGKFVNLDDSKLDYSFLYYLVMSSMFKLQLAEELATGAQPNISCTQIENFKFKIPSIDEQKGISKILNQINYFILLLEKEVDLLKLQKKGLMQLLLTGKVRVKV